MASWFRHRRDGVAAVAGLVILVLALVALRDLLNEVDPAQIGRAFATIPISGWLLALCATGTSYACLTLYDLAALRTLGSQVPYRTAATAATLSYAIANTLGLSLLTGGAVRLDIYRKAGLAEGDVARVVALAAITFWSGIFILFSVSLLLLPSSFSIGSFVVPDSMRLAIPALSALCLAGLVIWLAGGPRVLQRWGLTLPLPGPGLALGQVIVAALDLTACAAIIFVLMPGTAGSAFPALLGAYVIALGIAVMTHAPGGLGVFETVLIVLLPDTPTHTVAAALIGYRLVYYLVPFFIASVVIMVRARGALLGRSQNLARRAEPIFHGVLPAVLSGLVFVSGALLVWTSAVPAPDGEIERLAAMLPHEVYSLSHLASSVVGTLMLFVGWGLYRRIDAAWLASVVLALASLLFAFLLGPDWVQAVASLVLLIALVPARTAFYRQTSLFAQPFDIRWMSASGAVLSIGIFAGLWVFKHVEYSNDLWWQVRPAADASRFLRASLAGLLIVGFLALRWLLSPRPLAVQEYLPDDVFAAALLATDDSQIHLARTGDKVFLFAPDRDAFLMFRQSRNTLVAMGDPIGPRERWRDLVWRLRDLADQQRARLAFYECSAAMLEIAVDLGLGAIKLGEEARVPLRSFSLEGSERAKLRQAVSRAARDGLSFRVLPGTEASGEMEILQEISDEWLQAKQQREKQFSLGRFDRDYIAGAPIAIVEKNGQAIAFANLWPLPTKEELSFDLMRHASSAPPGTMDFMFSQLIVWARDHGYNWLSLGVSPLSGIDARRLAPLWARFADQVFRHGERLYGFEGLRRYKQKFLPVWRSRYLAAPRGAAMAFALFDILLLVSAPLTPRRARRRISERLPFEDNPELGVGS